MIDGYSHLNESITKTLDLISDVEMASKEQHKGIEQINDAIAELDQQTQQNANVAGATKGIAEQTNEIKILVENANQKANDGKKISDNMINGYAHLNESITKTLNLISDVEMASKEQHKGIEQINDAIAQLDQQTQQNANVAGATQCIAEQTNEIAFLVVRDTNEKEFEGKEKVKAKFLGNCEAKKVNAEQMPSTKVSSKSPIKQIKSDKASDEWASF
jgi:methyl-accepting chemotaxis protein